MSTRASMAIDVAILMDIAKALRIARIAVQRGADGYGNPSDVIENTIIGVCNTIERAMPEYDTDAWFDEARREA
jgi:hypothetical protein